MTTPRRTVDQAEIDRVVGNVYTNCVSYRLHQFLDPKGTGAKMRASEDLKKNLKLATQAYRLQTGQPAIQGGDLAKGFYALSPGGKKAIDSPGGRTGPGGLLLGIMKGALTEEDQETEPGIDAAAIKNFAELSGVGDDAGKMEMYRITITEWAQATYPAGRFPQSLPEIADLRSMINVSITGNRTVPECKEFITGTVRDRRRRYFEYQLRNKRNDTNALDRIRALTADDVGDDRIQNYIDGAVMDLDDLKKAVLNAVATWALKTFQGNFTESSALGEDMPEDPLLLDLDNPGLRHLSGGEVRYVLQSVRDPGAIDDLARECQKEVLRKRTSTRLSYFRAQAPDHEFNVRLINKSPIGG